MLFQANQQIGNYTLIKFLGEGGFGEVWLAENRRNPSSEKVAIKLPRKEQIDMQAVKDEIFNWTLSGKHENILPIIECETFGNQVAIVSEFAPDGSLQDLIEKHRVFSVADAVEIIIGILDGLAHLHNRKIIHRDLKPDNVLFQGRIPRLTDFGISRALPVNSQSATVSGTLAYMALECFDGKRNEQTDIWAVGAMLYQLLTGKLPFPQKTQEERIFAMVMNQPDSLPSSFPLDLQNIVKKSLEKEPVNRYQNAEEMRKDLSAFGLNLAQSVSTQTTKVKTRKIDNEAKAEQPIGFEISQVTQLVEPKPLSNTKSYKKTAVYLSVLIPLMIVIIIPLATFIIITIIKTSLENQHSDYRKFNALYNSSLHPISGTWKGSDKSTLKIYTDGTCDIQSPDGGVYSKVSLLSENNYAIFLWITWYGTVENSRSEIKQIPDISCANVDTSKLKQCNTMQLGSITFTKQ